MPEFLDILKLRVLLSFLNEDPRICTVTGLAGVLGEGKYRFPFLIYEEYVSGGTDLSMESAGFVHPCTLAEAGGVGTVCLHPVDASACSQMTGRGMNGRVRRLMYLDGDTFSPAYDDGSTISFPARTLHFLNIGSGMGQILHGSVCLRMQCSVGTKRVPESTAIFTILIRGQCERKT